MSLPPLSVPYVPGQTARPPEGLFEALHQSVPGRMPPEDLTACPAWTAGWTLFDLGYFWEAHEVWEPVWMALPQNSGARYRVQAAIQLTNAALKLRMGRRDAARRLCALAREAAARAGGSGTPETWGVSFCDRVAKVEARFE
ncbi:DUF309 domain-containing protein [Ruegeria pomeroyi]|nr:DUF309 domain-containing protein [Ruegeria pomeroyi]MCE8528932.1 DUF309 domain-containing protein [Ruegeria pomeroyi]